MNGDRLLDYTMRQIPLDQIVKGFKLPFEAVYVTASTLPSAEMAMHILKAVDAPKTRGANWSAAARSELGPVSSS